MSAADYEKRRAALIASIAARLLPRGPRPQKPRTTVVADLRPVEVVTPSPAPAQDTTPLQLSDGRWRGSCEALNPDTGRRCCLLSGHATPHRHGRTDFYLAAVPGQPFARARQLEDAANARRAVDVHES